MKGNHRIVQTSKSLLADELTAISQLMVHSGICENWGSKKLHDHFEKRATTRRNTPSDSSAGSFSLRELPSLASFSTCTLALMFLRS